MKAPKWEGQGTFEESKRFNLSKYVNLFPPKDLILMASEIYSNFAPALKDTIYFLFLEISTVVCLAAQRKLTLVWEGLIFLQVRPG